MSDAQVSTALTRVLRMPLLSDRRVALRHVAAVVLLGTAYYGAAKLGQTLRYTASVSAIWPPVGLGIAALYLWGLRLWPGIFLGELLVNAELLVDHAPLPAGSLAGQQLGNMAEIVVGAWLLRRLLGPRAKLDRASQVGKMIVAVGTATAISATVGTVSMLAGDVIEWGEVPTFWRTWWLGDTAGALVVLPLVLTWVGDWRGAWRRIWCLEGVLMILTVIALATVAVSTEAPLTYLIFPALIWAAFRFGPAGVTAAATINAGITIGVTADSVGAFFNQPIDNRTLSTQLYILIAGLTALFLSAVVSEREQSSAELVAARRHEHERVLEERHRIARDLHDSVSQALFSSGLHTRSAQRALERGGADAPTAVGRSLIVIAELTKRAQREMRSFIFDWGPDGVGEGLVLAFSRHASSVTADSGLAIRVEGTDRPLPLPLKTQNELYAIGREALSNVVRHAGASKAVIRVDFDEHAVHLVVEDDGVGFVPAPSPGHHGLESMQSRANEIGGQLRISSTLGQGTVIRMDLPAENGN